MKKLLLVALMVSFTSACALFPGDGDTQMFGKKKRSNAIYAQKFNSKMRGMTAELSKKLKGFKPSTTKVVVTTFTPVGSYEKADLFGKLCQERMLAGLSEWNFKVYDMRQTKNILVKENTGFFSLSDKVDLISGNVNTDLILVGSYAMVGGELMISSMLVRADNSEVVSSATEMMQIEGDLFLEPLISATSHGDSSGGYDSAQADGGLRIREPALVGTDRASKLLPLKIDKISSDIAKNLKRGGTNKRIIVTTYVDLDHLKDTNSFGRFITEHLMESLTHQGFSVIEVRLAKEISSAENIGELVLTRNMSEMMNKYRADAMIVGTYKVFGDTVKVHSRMVIDNNQEVISVANMEMRLDPEDKFTKALFGNKLSLVSRKERVEGYRK